MRSRYLQWPGKSSCSVESLLSWGVHQFWIYFLYHITWIPRRINLFLSLIKWPGKKRVFCENNLLNQNKSTNTHNMKTWQKRTLFLQNTSSGCFCIEEFIFFYWRLGPSSLIHKTTSGQESSIRGYNQPLQPSYKLGVLKHFVKFTRYDQQWSLFFKENWTSWSEIVLRKEF